jgi:hypothetical protein
VSNLQVPIPNGLLAILRFSPFSLHMHFSYNQFALSITPPQAHALSGIASMWNVFVSLQRIRPLCDTLDVRSNLQFNFGLTPEHKEIKSCINGGSIKHRRFLYRLLKARLSEAIIFTEFIPMLWIGLYHLMVEIFEVEVFWVVTLCSVVVGYQSFRGR